MKTKHFSLIMTCYIFKLLNRTITVQQN